MNMKLHKKVIAGFFAFMLIIVIGISGCAKETAENDDTTTVEESTTEAETAPEIEMEEDGLIYVHAGADGSVSEPGELPLGVRITYELDGAPVTPEELPGKSGNLTMHFAYENRTSYEAKIGEETCQVKVPLLAMTLVLLPEDVFADVSVENGEIYTMGDTCAAVGTVYPGLKESLALEAWDVTKDADLPEEFSLSAEVTDFQLEFTATIVQPVSLEDLKEEDLNDLQDLADGMEDLKDASEELKDGTSEFADAASKAKTQISKYVDGAGKVADGVASLNDGAKALADQGDALKEGAENVESGIGALAEGLSGLQTLLSQIPVDTESEDPNVQAQAELIAQAAEIAGQLAENAETLKSGTEEFNKGVSAYTEGVSTLSDGAGKLEEGASALSSSGSSVKKGLSSLASAAGELKDGIKEFCEDGIEELTEKAGPGMQEVIRRLRAVKEAGQQYRYPGVEQDDWRIIFETAELR